VEPVGRLPRVRVSVGSDHAGYELKGLLIEHLKASGHDVADLGTNSMQPVDYPAFGAAVGRSVVSGDADLGLCICGTGIGISVAANKVRGVRAAVVHDASSARLAREHNGANVICFGARLVGPEVAVDSLDAFIKSEFQGGRHMRRIEQIAALEAESTDDPVRARF
jgi:ribose 5-phosphate isomerase B